MFTSLPQSAQEIINWTWPQIEPYYHDLGTRSLTAENAHEWLSDWTSIAARVYEMYTRLYVTHTRDTTDADALAARRRLQEILDQHPAAPAGADARGKRKQAKKKQQQMP